MNFAGSGRALNSRALARSYRHSAALHRPAVRASVTAGAALAGWQFGRSRGGGWWRHGNGGYGWVGPLFWPFAYFDIYDYALWGPRVGAPFWYYGYDDIYTGLFGPYDYQGLAGYLPPRGSPGAGPDRLALLCGEDSREIAGLRNRPVTAPLGFPFLVFGDCIHPRFLLVGQQAVQLVQRRLHDRDT